MQWALKYGLQQLYERWLCRHHHTKPTCSCREYHPTASAKAIIDWSPPPELAIPSKTANGHKDCEHLYSATKNARAPSACGPVSFHRYLHQLVIRCLILQSKNEAINPAAGTPYTKGSIFFLPISMGIFILKCVLNLS